MFVDLPQLATESARRRAELLADAENYRLARLARQARRRRRAALRRDPSPPDSAARNDEADRRYAMSR